MKLPGFVLLGLIVAGAQLHESSGRSVRIIENGRETIETVAIPFAF